MTSYLKKFGSQMVVLYPDQKILKTHINESFHTAGTQFSWKGNPEGIGLSEIIVQYAYSNGMDIVITVSDNPDMFFTSASQWKNVCETNKQFWDVNNGTKLYVFQFSRMERI